jgi:inhibitor of KinA
MPAATMQPMGDQAVLATFPEEEAALRWAKAVRAQGLAWVVDVVAAYTSVAVYVDLDRTSCSQAAGLLPPLVLPAGVAPVIGQLREIPCCYELQHDLQRVSSHCGLAPEEVVALHAGTEYTVYAIGFCPGFPYLGYLPPPLCNVPRLPTPRLRVPPGSVGLTGRQTGIYPLERPGGWNLIGRTPLQLVDVEAGYFPLRAGDRVRFVPVGEAEYRQLEGSRL